MCKPYKNKLTKPQTNVEKLGDNSMVVKPNRARGGMSYSQK